MSWSQTFISIKMIFQLAYHVASIYRSKWRDVCYLYWNNVYTNIFPHALINAILFCAIVIWYDMLFCYFCYFYRLQFLFNPNSETHPGVGNFTLDWNGCYDNRKEMCKWRVSLRWRLMSTMASSRLLTQPFIRAQIQEIIKAPRYWPLCGGNTGDRWHKWPVTKKMFLFDDVIIPWLQSAPAVSYN